MPRQKSHILSRGVRQFLREPRLARLATIETGRRRSRKQEGHGYPHIVPLYFMLDGNDIIFGSDRDERKVRNALANPKAAVVIGGEPETDRAGYMIQGDLCVEEDPGHAKMLRLLRRYETEQDAADLAAEWGASDTVILRLKPKRVIRVW